MGWAGFDGGVGGEGGSHALRAQGSNGDAHGRCALRNGSPLANRLRTGQRPPEEKAPPNVRGEEGISPVSLQYLQEPQGDSGGQTRGSGYAAPDPRVQRTPCTESGAPGDGMAKWVCRPCKRTARQRSR